MFLLSYYEYDLPDNRIAQFPCQNRAGSKLLCIKRLAHQCSHHRFSDLPLLLRKNDLLVINNTKVVPARIIGHKPTGGKVEIFILDYVPGIKNLEQKGFFASNCLIKASRMPKTGDIIYLDAKENSSGIKAKILAVDSTTGGTPIFFIQFPLDRNFPEWLQLNGLIPLPPYIKRSSQDIALSDLDQQRYQTVYAQKAGAVAAPTAGLHFTPDILRKIEDSGIELAKITLHVGYGTFSPVKCQDIRKHKIHSEIYSISQEAACQINKAKNEGRRIVAVGTTTVRTLEYLADNLGHVMPGSGTCDLYIYPGYNFKCVDAMITNFHLPKSTLLMLVSAFYDKNRILSAYKVAIEKDYRFFSYGDAMLIE